MTKISDHLLEHGPTPLSELSSSVKTRDKIDGVAIFQLSGTHAKGEEMFGRLGGDRGQEPVAYLYGYHTPEDVLWAFFEANREVVERTYEQMSRPQRSWVTRISGHGGGYKEATRSVLREMMGEA